MDLTMKTPRVIQAVFHDHDGNDIAHDYYLDATWITALCERHGAFNIIGPYIRRAIESKRKQCIERYGTEWGADVVQPGKKRRKIKRKADKPSE